MVNPLPAPSIQYDTFMLRRQEYRQVGGTVCPKSFLPSPHRALAAMRRVAMNTDTFAIAIRQSTLISQCAPK